MAAVMCDLYIYRDAVVFFNTDPFTLYDQDQGVDHGRIAAIIGHFGIRNSRQLEAMEMPELDNLNDRDLSQVRNVSPMKTAY